MTGKIAASVMCANLGHLADDIKKLENAGVEYVHVDIMDGSFVPNFTFGTDFCEALRGMTDLPLDIHLMIQKPELHIAAFKPRPGEYICVHQEATVHLQRTLALIKSFGAMAAVALNPATPIYTIEDVLEDIDMVLIMTVNPGYAGQLLVPQTLDKIARMRAFLDARGFEKIAIEVDGNVSFENAEKMRAAGADIFVAGSSSVFIKALGIEKGAQELRKHIL
ncbi:MAG: ribulose-phosphate 3-epimerase [Clostridia bacterium]